MKYIAALLLVFVTLTAYAQTDPEATAEAQAGDEREDEHGIAQVYVPAGCFLMGITSQQAQELRQQSPPAWLIREFPSEIPQHEVCLTSSYWIDKYEVTNEAFQAFVDGGGYTTQEYWSDEGWEWLSEQDVEALPDDCVEAVPDHPRTCVTWFEAEAYANWRGGTLPTEAQWEYAARGPEGLIYPWGDEWDANLANVLDSEEATAVGSYPDGVSWVGALDMSGNVMEWVQDWLDPNYYDDSPADDPLGPESGRIKVERGGWFGSNHFVARTTYRHFEDPPTYADHHIGLRVVSPVGE